MDLLHNYSIWFQAIRPKTLIASFSPLLIGLAFAFKEGFFSFFYALITLLVALGIQITANLANDYFDYEKGADTIHRKGPLRVTQAGLVSPQKIKQAVLLTVLTTSILSSFLILKGGVLVAVLSSLSILLALGYTTGPFPLAYLGLGDLFVFFFFGPIATSGTYFLQTGALSLEVMGAGIGCGLLSTAILTVNNVRDSEEDKVAHKKTLSVRFGKIFGKWEYTLALILAPLPSCLSHHFLPLLILIPALPLIKTIWQDESPQALNQLLGKTAGLLGVYTLLMILSF
jgi:1,4-dihydroxy-2-naphthoate octaprenyltransferase